MAVYDIRSYLGIGFAQEGRVVARAPDGTLWCVYTRSDGAILQIWAAYSIDDGVTWTEEQVSYAPTNSQLHPAIAVDSNSDVHVVWHGPDWGANPLSNSVQYRCRESGTWQAQEEVSNYLWNQERPVIAVDSDDDIHVVFESNGGIGTATWANIAHRERTTLGWQALSVLSDTPVAKEYPTVAIDSTDDLHIAYISVGFKRVSYVTGVSGAWGAVEEIDITLRICTTPHIALDQIDQPHVAWTYNAGAGTIVVNYSWRTGGVWQAVETLPSVAGSSQGNPSLAISMDGSIHCIWSGKGWGVNPTFFNILHLIRGAGWPAAPEIIVDDAIADMYPCILWANYPVTGTFHDSIPLEGYAAVYIEQAAPVSDIAKIILSGDLSWLVAPTVSTLAASGVT